VLDAFGIEPERLAMDLSIDLEGKKIPLLVGQMRNNLVKLGPVKQV
jgi:coenzyme F420-reducing hydrogenase delta subunit